MQCLLAFIKSCDYYSFVDCLLYGKQDCIDTSQLNFIFKVVNFYDVEDIPVVFWLFVSITKHFKLYNIVHTIAGIVTFSMHANMYISCYMENGYL
jgi:hypothetical protein